MALPSRVNRHAEFIPRIDEDRKGETVHQVGEPREPHVSSPSCIMYNFRVPALEIMRLLSSFLVMICTKNA